MFVQIEVKLWNRTDPRGESVFDWIGEHIFEPIGDFFQDIFEDPYENEKTPVKNPGEEQVGEDSRTEEEGEKIYRIVELGDYGPPISVGAVDRDGAISASRTGLDILAPDRFSARDVAWNAGGGGMPIEDKPHKSAGPGALPHFHPVDIFGKKLQPSRHVFYPF
ncbi:MAG: hypothetical protein HYZ67_07190 [Chlamydiae bacterium]|nr:hypothetical protein [Chlamydiota bacterium]